MSRPDPLKAAETVRGLAMCHRELRQALTRVTPNRNHSSPDGRPPLDLDVLDAMRAIEDFASTYAHMLMDDDPEWMPPATVPATLEALALRIGHFTENETALIAYEFDDDLQRVSDETWPIARPNGIGRIPLGPCAEDDCEGIMRATIDRDKVASTSLDAMWDKALRCNLERAHVTLLGEYAQGRLGMDRGEIAEMVAAYLAEVA